LLFHGAAFSGFPAAILPMAIPDSAKGAAFTAFWQWRSALAQARGRNREKTSYRR
jgi:hypothetical protein